MSLTRSEFKIPDDVSALNVSFWDSGGDKFAVN